MEITQGNLTALFTGLRATFLDAVRAAKLPANVADLVFESSSSKATEQYPTAAVLGDLEELLDEYTQLNLGEFMQNVANRHFGRDVSIPRMNIQSDSIGMYKLIMGRMGRLAATFPYRQIPQLFINGFATAWIDGTNVWANGHVWPGGQAWDNLDYQALTTPGYRLVRQHLRERIGPDGQALELMPTHLICGAANEAAAKTVLRADLTGGSTNVDRDEQIDIVIWGGLTGNYAYYWFLVDASDVRPVVIQNFDGPDLVANDAPTSNARFKRERMEYGARRTFGEAIVAPWVVQAVRGDDDGTPATTSTAAA